MKNNNYIIIGASAAGIAAAKKIRSLDAQSDILCFTYESEFPYNKCLLVDWIAQDKTEQEIQLHSQDFFTQQRITLVCGVRIASLDAEKKSVTTDAGDVYEYTTLLLATGASPVKLFVPGTKNAAEIIPFYTYADADRIKHTIQQEHVQNIIVIGGGISGIECADSLKMFGKKITVLERGPHILGRQVDEACAQYIEQKIQQFDIAVLCNTQVQSLVTNNQGRVTAVECSNGMQIPADLVISALGSRANTELAINAHLDIEHGAVVTNQFLQTSNCDIFAAGDCALVHNLVTNTPMRSMMWPDAVAQGMVAGTNMVTLSREYKGVVPLTISHFFGGNFVSCGLLPVKGRSHSVEIISTDSLYSAIAFDEHRVVTGFILFGENLEYTHLKKSLITKTPL